jgi:hypothetical protein
MMLAMKVIWIFCLICLFLLLNDEALAGELSERLAHFPQWEKLTSVRPAVGDLVYPDWMMGSWQVKSTLVDLVAPLAPDIVTPGFEGNRQYLKKPISFPVRFVRETTPNPALKIIPQISRKAAVVADRAFNGLNLARAYLGDRSVLSVKVDPDSPNRQITLLRGDRQLVSIVTTRATETTPDGEFITTEVFQQLFKGGGNPYFNTVESTTAYYRKLDELNPLIEADQVTAVYLSPQDPDYFTAGSRPVALYRYRLEFIPTEEASIIPQGGFTPRTID